MAKKKQKKGVKVVRTGARSLLAKGIGKKTGKKGGKELFNSGLTFTKNLLRGQEPRRRRKMRPRAGKQKKKRDWGEKGEEKITKGATNV